MFGEVTALGMRKQPQVFDDLSGGTPRTAHVITNAIVDAIDTNTAEMRSRYVVFQATGSVALQPIAVGRYRDTVQRIDGRWRIVRRQMLPQLWGNTTDHLTFDPTGLI